jgi:hypothetical protein
MELFVVRRSSAMRRAWPWRSLRVAVMRELLDVVHEREDLPLPVDLRLPAQREAIELLVVKTTP